MAKRETDDMMTLHEVCRFFGGEAKPIDSSTLYRGIKRGVYPRPIKLSSKMSRWRRRDCAAALKALVKKSGGAK